MSRERIQRFLEFRRFRSSQKHAAIVIQVIDFQNIKLSTSLALTGNGIV